MMSSIGFWPTTVIVSPSVCHQVLYIHAKMCTDRFCSIVAQCEPRIILPGLQKTSDKGKLVSLVPPMGRTAVFTNQQQTGHFVQRRIFPNHALYFATFINPFFHQPSLSIEKGCSKHFAASDLYFYWVFLSPEPDTAAKVS